jgi:hypothetical protein
MKKGGRVQRYDMDQRNKQDKRKNPARGMDVVCCECCVLSGRGLCDGLITRPEESYRVCVCLSVIVKPR